MDSPVAVAKPGGLHNVGDLPGEFCPALLPQRVTSRLVTTVEKRRLAQAD
mgnify:CR=1 FL=1